MELKAHIGLIKHLKAMKQSAFENLKLLSYRIMELGIRAILIGPKTRRCFHFRWIDFGCPFAKVTIETSLALFYLDTCALSPQEFEGGQEYTKNY